MFLDRSDAFLQFSISWELIYFEALCDCLQHSCHSYSVLRVYISTLTPRRKRFWLEVQESRVRVLPPQCLIEECLCASSLHKASCMAHQRAPALFFSISVKGIFVTLIINYQYWHRDYIWLNLRWKFENWAEEPRYSAAFTALMRWNRAFENSGFNGSQCLADYFF